MLINLRVDQAVLDRATILSKQKKPFRNPIRIGHILLLEFWKDDKIVKFAQIAKIIFGVLNIKKEHRDK